MRISFDIDGTLIPFSDEFEIESSYSFFSFAIKEKLRKGVVDLFKELKNDGHEVWIYTTSFRSIWKLRLIFAQYGLYPKGFINQSVNQLILKENNQTVSKNPNLFDIDLHIDDSEGVKIEGDLNGFNTLILRSDDKQWKSKVLSRVEKIANTHDS